MPVTIVFDVTHQDRNIKIGIQPVKVDGLRRIVSTELVENDDKGIFLQKADTSVAGGKPLGEYHFWTDNDGQLLHKNFQQVVNGEEIDGILVSHSRFSKES
jgi:hypothetical protein